MSTLLADAEARVATLAQTHPEMYPQPVELRRRAHPRDPATETAIALYQWRAPVFKARRERRVVEHIVVDPDVYARLDGRGRDALLAVELTRADHVRRTLSAAPLGLAATWQLDRLLRRSGTGRADTAVITGVLAAAAGAFLPLPVAPPVRLVLLAVVIATVVWAFDAAITRGLHLHADRVAARWIGADAVRYMLMTLSADEHHPEGAAAWRVRWLGYQPTLRHRLKSLNRVHAVTENLRPVE
ncbi:hypothetical protein [Nocardia farcinica]|uniref:hypothetical protein n=1 Tax=Nocardia farcinica TaxID=37329 RepID=UPI00189416A2|nr:hypothetical protein [Nocardia farcinica]MBF6410874.1 hypothetical protein [Nocardia farcinica]UEX26016.1 hypothetical protein LMJ57_29660 [Nocardia farcinica]